MNDAYSCAEALMRWSIVCGMEDYRQRMQQKKLQEEAAQTIALSPGSGVSDVEEENKK